jgi:hypothetical protein
MAREMTLNDPLSGAEIKEISVRKFAEALNRDCTLTDDITYPGFSLCFEARISFVRSTTPPTLIWGDVNGGLTVKGGPDTEAIVSVASGAYETDSPNTAREENSLPIPVMIQTPSGPKREKVKFQVPAAYGKK